MAPASFTCFLVDQSDGNLVRAIPERPSSDLPAGDVLLELEYSAVNYKDALAASGHKGVALNLPLVPGIDGVGTVLESNSDRCRVGDKVMVSGADFGTRNWGGWATMARVDGTYCIPLPKGLNEREAAIIGTAGFTAAQSVERLQHHGITPEKGPILVTGATGGVGTFGVALLAQLGFEVVAVTGKADQVDWLKALGASEVISREEACDDSTRPLLSGKWAGAIDTVGGKILDTTLRATQPRGCVTACGLVAGHQLEMTVYPFILRGVSLQGIDSATASVAYREQLWQRLATDLKVEDLDRLATDVALEDVENSVVEILAGQVRGRHVVVTRSS